MKKFLLIALLLNSLISLAQAKYLLPNEEIVFTFRTQKGKIMMLAKDKANAYLVYRFGSEKSVELEFPEKKDKESFEKFKYSYVMRGGGKMNAAIDLNYVAFVSGDFKYVIYDTYFSESNTYAIGVRVLKPTNDELIVNIKGKYKTSKGNIVDFRFNELIPEDEEGMLYD